MRYLVHQVRLFFIALQFFTRLPIPRWVGFEAAWLQHASRYFPLVGLVVAVLCALVYGYAFRLWSAPVAALLSTAAGIYLTGAFHEDGFADTCDGFGGGQTRARVMEIMKDSRIGTYGAVGAGLLIALKCALLAHMTPTDAVHALLLAHPLSRLCATTLIWKLDYARDEGKAKPMAQQMTGAELATAAVCGLAPVLIYGLLEPSAWPKLAACVLLAAGATAWLAFKFVRRIGGYTGDCLGAVQQVSEVAVYLCLSAAVGC